MTRFARAKGSKASNLKSPEDSTPWEVMKEQLLKSKKECDESKNREEAEKQRIENYNNFLKEHKTQKRKATWCEFPEAKSSNKINLNPAENKDHVKKKKKKLNSESTISNSQEKLNNGVDAEVNQKKDKALKKKIKNDKFNNIEPSTTDIDVYVDQKKDIELKKRIKNKKFNNIESSTTDISDSNHQDNVNMSTEQNEDTSNQTQVAPQKKKKKKKQNQPTEVKTKIQTDLSTSTSEKEVNQEEHNVSLEIVNKKRKKNKKQKNSKPNLYTENNKSDDKIEHQVTTAKQNSPSKKNKNKKGRRKPETDKSFRLIINSKEVQLVRFDGFPIMKKDADRLEELKKSMIQKGIPKSEVQRTMKLERRRAEKALARLKRDVCYNCRKGGHNLSDCPDLKTNIPGAGAEGVCFKCGSTEHRQFECKVQRDKEFRFATCFICKEAGHIARQCPDNPKGLYPNGGCCKLCGDVTHLRKDCPTVNEKKESTSIKLQTLTGDNIEDLEQHVKTVPEEPVSKKPKKIKF